MGFLKTAAFLTISCFTLFGAQSLAASCCDRGCDSCGCDSCDRDCDKCDRGCDSCGCDSCGCDNCDIGIFDD